MNGARTISLGAVAAFAATLIVLGGAVSAQSTAPAGTIKHGQHVFEMEGCYECHGWQGEGTGSRAPRGAVGPSLAPHPIAYTAFIAQVRKPRDTMPVYGPNILSDKDAADIYAYLASIPAGKPASTIPLLNSVSPAGGSPKP